jgi:hypothetical protein
MVERDLELARKACWTRTAKKGRSFYWLPTLLITVFAMSYAGNPPAAMAARPATRRVSDTVHRADGTVAAGMVLISWPVFTVSDGTPGASHPTSVALGHDGSSSAAQPKAAIDVRDHGVDCTGSAASDGALDSAAIAGAHAVIPQGCVVRLSTSKSYTLALEFKQDGQLKPDNGVIVTLTGNIVAGRQQIFANALPGQGKIDFTGNAGLSEVFPEWWGAGPSATAAVNTRALQAAEYGAFGTNRSNGTGLNQWNKRLSLCGIYNISGEIKFYHVIGFEIGGCGKLSSAIVQNDKNKRIIDGQNIAYGTIHDLSFSTVASQTGPLVDLDNDRTNGTDLSPQNITLKDVVFSGNNAGADVGVLIAKHGGDAQGDNIRCEDCYFSGFSGAGWQVGGNNTGRNAGRFYAYNAIKQQIKGGDMQGNPLYGVAVYGGSIEVDGTTMENDSLGFGTQTGFDVYCEGPQDRCVMRNVRSESHKLASGVGLIEHSRTLFQPTSWYSVSRSQSLAGATVKSTGGLFSGTGQCGDGKYYQFTSTGTLGGLGITNGSGGSATTITASASGWTTNAFVGQMVCIVAGTGNGQYMIVTANDKGSTIKGSGGWQTKYYHLLIVNPDTTSRFVIEPNWGTQFTSGTVRFALFDFRVVDGCTAGGSTQGNMGNCLLFDVAAPGGTINAGGQFSRLENVFPSRTDWGGTGFGLEDALITNTYQNVVVERPDSAISVGGTSKQLTWSFVRNSGAKSFYSGPSFINVGTQPICWSYGQNGGGESANDVCVGIRTDNGSLNSASRAVLGFMGTLGPVTPWGKDKNGAINRIQGGLPTGAGTPGDIAFSTGNATASGTTVIDGTDRWQIKGTTGHLFANVDNTYDIGASEANRPRNLWLGNNADIAGNLTVHGICTGCGSRQNVTDSGVVVGPYAIPWITASNSGGSTATLPSSANMATIYGVVLTIPITTTQVTYNVITADASPNTYDIGIYDNNGNLKVHTGRVAGSTAMTSGVHSVRWTVAATLQPGRYYLAITSSCTARCGQMAAMDENGTTFVSNYPIGVSSGGMLNERITPPEDTFSFESTIPAWIVW